MTHPSPAEDQASPRPRRTRRVLVATAIVLMLAMWGYVLYLAFGPGRQDPPDRLDDPAFAEEAQVICRAALDDVATLPPAVEARDSGDRADIVEDANARFEAMLDDLEAITPSGADGNTVSEWLADWRTYLGDRADYADALREDPAAQLLVTAKDREQITEFVDAFAADNRMPSCGTPIDV